MLSEAGPVGDIIQHAERLACRAQQVMMPQAPHKPTGKIGSPSLLLIGSAQQGLQVLAHTGSGVHTSSPCA